LVAKGSKERKIVFTSAERSPKPGDWGAINFLDSTENSFEHCEISYANTGVHGHGVTVALKNCYVHHNGVGIAFNNKPGFRTKSSVGINNSQIIGNGGGILCGRQTVSRIGHNQIANNKLYGIFGKGAGSSQVRYNNISHNGKGVILYATRGFRVNENNLSENEGYAVSLLEGQIYDVDARKNWWGTKDKRKIKELIWDKDEERALGRVNFSGFAGSAIEGAGLSG
jgi:parallel beta-helix repeat protein